MTSTFKSQLAELLTALFSKQEIQISSDHFERIINIASPKIEKDLTAYVINDPAAHGSKKMVLESYRCFHAVMLYRVANALLIIDDSLDYRIAARKIGEYARINSGVDIHPAADIGVPFVIDHGSGTVIGETVKIGNNCYILNNVTLGATGVSNNPRSKRHPTIGNNVQIGASASVYGPITVGDDCFIGPYSTVTADVPASTKVSCSFRIQQFSQVTTPIEIFGIIPEMQVERIVLQGKNLNTVNLEFSIKGRYTEETPLLVQASSENQTVLSYKTEYTRLRKSTLTIRKNGIAILSLILSPTIFI